MIPEENRLELEPIGIDEACNALLNLVRVSRETQPVQNKRTITKMSRWAQQLSGTVSVISQARTTLAAELEARFGLALDDELLAAAMFQPSTRNLFLEMETQYCCGAATADECEHIRTLSMLSDLSKVLALVGDAALSMAILHRLWKPSAREAGQLTQSRASLVSNEHLAQICDSWRLYEHRIHFDPETSTKSEIDHIKGSLLEAVLGIVYMKHGFDAFVSIISRFF